MCSVDPKLEKCHLTFDKDMYIVYASLAPSLDTEEGVDHDSVAVAGICVWLCFICLEWLLLPSLSGLVCGCQREVEKGGNRGYASLSSIGAKESWFQYLRLVRKLLLEQHDFFIIVGGF